MKEVHDNLIITVTIGLLLLSFFSYYTHLSTGAFTILGGGKELSCADVEKAANFREDDYKSSYDLNYDGRIDFTDVELIKEAVRDLPCPDNECAELGRTRCDVLGRIVTCEMNDYGMKVEIVDECPSGQKCVTKQINLRRNRADDFMHGGSVINRFARCEYNKHSFIN